MVRCPVRLAGRREHAEPRPHQIGDGLDGSRKQLVRRDLFGSPHESSRRFRRLGLYQTIRPVVIGVVLIAATAVVVANLVVDAFYAVLDPRVRLR